MLAGLTGFESIINWEFKMRSEERQLVVFIDEIKVTG